MAQPPETEVHRKWVIIPTGSLDAALVPGGMRCWCRGCGAGGVFGTGRGQMVILVAEWRVGSVQQLPRDHRSRTEDPDLTPVVSYRDQLMGVDIEIMHRHKTLPADPKVQDILSISFRDPFFYIYHNQSARNRLPRFLNIYNLIRKAHSAKTGIGTSISTVISLQTGNGNVQNQISAKSFSFLSFWLKSSTVSSST